MSCDRAVRELLAARTALLAVHTLPNDTSSERREKREARKEAIAKLALAARMIDEIVLAAGGELE
jgi:hypothetical protein